MLPIIKYTWYVLICCPVLLTGEANVCNAPLFTVTDSITVSSVNLNWTDFNETVSGWEIEWGLKGFTRSEIPNTELITETHYLLDSLSPGTAYDVYIRTVCSDGGNSNWNGPFRIRTAIDNENPCGLSLEIKDNNCPRIEDFDIDVKGYEGLSLGTDIFIQSVDLIIEHDWPADLQLSLQSPNGKQILLSQNRGIGQDHYGNPNDSTCLEVCNFSDFACTPISNAGTGPLLGSFLPEEKISGLYDNGSVNGLWKIRMCDRALEDKGTLRSVKINFAPIICNVPTEIAAKNISDNAATIQWAPPENCKVAIINVVLSGQAPGSNIEIFTSCQSGSFEVTGLIPETAYDIYIRSDCNTSKSAFSCPASFVTACNPVTMSSSFDNLSLCVESCNVSCLLDDTWRNSDEDEQDWLVHSGPTITENTGPEGDISGVGNYLYIENTIDLCGIHNQAILEANCIEVTENPGPCDMSFYYNMFGDNIDSLLLKISNDNGESWHTIFEANGDKGPVWRRQFVDLSEYAGQLCSFRFIARSGDDDRADIALDQIEFYGSNTVSALPVFYFDSDLDGYGGTDSIIHVCLNNPPEGFTLEPADCDDTNASIYPGAPEIQCNLIDENCNGNDDDAAEANPITYFIDNVVNESCPGAKDASISIQVNGGNPPYLVQWNNGMTGEVILNLEENVYYATISDAGTCTIETEFIDIDVNSSPQLFFIRSQPSQCNGATGFIDIEVAGGIAPYSYLWNDGIITQDRSSIAEGIFSVTATDAKGCQVTLSDIRIESSPRFTAGIQSKKDLTCYGDSNGMISIGIFNAVPPVTYLWSNGDTTSTVRNLREGNYSVTINDARGCKEIIQATINSPVQLNSEITGIEQVTCFNGSNGSIQVTTDGGSPPYNFQWKSNPQLSFAKSKQEDISDLAPGTYQLYVSDGKGCEDTTIQVTLENPSEISIIQDSVNFVRCKLSNDGFIQVDVKGGGGNYSYFWGNNDNNGPFLENLKSGIYNLTVIDKFGCKKTVNDLTVGVLNKPIQVLTSVISDNVCSYDSVGKITAEVNEGISPVDFNWSSGRQVIKPGLRDTVSRLAGGTYMLTVTDNEGCVGISGVNVISSISEVRPESIDIELNECNSDNQGMITLNVSGGSPPYLYQWNNGSDKATLENLSNGSYRVTVTDSGDCRFFFGPMVVSSTDPILTQARVTMVSGGLDNGSIELDIIGGDPPYQIDWDQLPDGMESHFNLPGGIYCATITDSKNCFTTECFSLDQSNSLYPDSNIRLKVFPNPTTTGIWVESDLFVIGLDLFSPDGKRIYSESFNSNSVFLPLTHVNPGLYFLKIKTSSGTNIARVVKY